MAIWVAIVVDNEREPIAVVQIGDGDNQPTPAEVTAARERIEAAAELTIDQVFAFPVSTVDEFVDEIYDRFGDDDRVIVK